MKACRKNVTIATKYVTTCNNIWRWSQINQNLFVLHFWTWWIIFFAEKRFLQLAVRCWHYNAGSWIFVQSTLMWWSCRLTYKRCECTDLIRSMLLMFENLWEILAFCKICILFAGTLSWSKDCCQAGTSPNHIQISKPMTQSTLTIRQFPGICSPSPQAQQLSKMFCNRLDGWHKATIRQPVANSSWHPNANIDEMAGELLSNMTGEWFHSNLWALMGTYVNTLAFEKLKLAAP